MAWITFVAILNIYDDHEIENDFNGYSNESTPIWANASNAWAAYQGQANYDSHLVDANGHQPYYFDFVHGDVAFFVLDTRRYAKLFIYGRNWRKSFNHFRYRSVVGVNQTEGEVPTILGDKQMADFTKWVGKVRILCLLSPLIRLRLFSSRLTRLLLSSLLFRLFL